MNEYIYDNNVKDEIVVICCECALARNGLIYHTGHIVKRFVKYKDLDNLNLVEMKFVYNPNIDYENYVTPEPHNKLILKPTKERAIVEAIQYLDYCDEGELIIALQNYMEQQKDLELLYRVAEFFKLKKETLDYWLQEAREEDWDGN